MNYKHPWVLTRDNTLGHSHTLLPLKLHQTFPSVQLLIVDLAGSLHVTELLPESLLKYHQLAA